jgi:hypothetical protein
MESLSKHNTRSCSQQNNERKGNKRHIDEQARI